MSRGAFPPLTRLHDRRDTKFMADQHEEHLNATEARAGTTPHVTRYVLGVGLFLVIVIFAVILFVAA